MAVGDRIRIGGTDFSTMQNFFTLGTGSVVSSHDSAILLDISGKGMVYGISMNITSTRTVRIQVDGGAIYRIGTSLSGSNFYTLPLFLSFKNSLVISIDNINFASSYFVSYGLE